MRFCCRACCITVPCPALLQRSHGSCHEAAPSHPDPPSHLDTHPLTPLTHTLGSVRKGYHLLAVTLFLPVLLVEPGLLGLALAIAFAGLVAVEAVRSAALPGVSLRITDFMERFTDARDAGPIYVTHFALLLGMALPVWLSLDWEAGERQGPPGLLEGGAVRARAPALAGILILGAFGL